MELNNGDGTSDADLVVAPPAVSSQSCDGLSPPIAAYHHKHREQSYAPVFARSQYCTLLPHPSRKLLLNRRFVPLEDNKMLSRFANID